MVAGRFRLEVEISPKLAWSRQVGVDLEERVDLGMEVGVDLGMEVDLDLEKEVGGDLGQAVGFGLCGAQDFRYLVIVAVVDVVVLVIVAHLHDILQFF